MTFFFKQKKCSINTKDTKIQIDNKSKRCLFLSPPPTKSPTRSTIAQGIYWQTPVLGLGLGVDFTLAWDNDNKNHKNHNNPHLNFVKGTVLGVKEQGVGIRDKG